MRIVSFDFVDKQEKTLTWESIKGAADPGLFYWIEMEGADAEHAQSVLALFAVNELAASEFLGPDREGRYDVYEDCLHFALTEGQLVESRLVTSHIDILLGTSYMIMWHRRPVRFVEQMRRTYREDFRRFAKSPGFLVYELGDHLIESYRRVYASFAESVERVQLNLFGTVDDEIFPEVSGLTTDLLALRKVVQASRELMHQLAARRSPFVSETTQSFLQGMAATLERLSDDLTSEREVLNETLNLYMGMVSHRTNRIINRLTVISMIFLPLTFMCGVYGMNFDVMPELRWAYSYLVFWGVCLAFVTLGVLFMKRKKWL